jgi:hypothetical protein
MSFKDGRIGVGKDPIFPLDISGSCRIDGDLILGGRFSDSQGNPIQLGSGSGATSTPDQTSSSLPSWEGGTISTQGLGVFKGKMTANSIYISGDNTLPASVTGADNTAVGYLALQYTNKGNNTAIGTCALQGKVSYQGIENSIGIGWNAGRYQGASQKNIWIGYQAGPQYNSATAGTGNNNICIGDRPGYSLTTGNQNILMGVQSGWVINTGYDNIMLGYQAGVNTTSGLRNVYIGMQAGYSNVAGQNSVCIGTAAGQWKTGASKMVAIGYEALNHADGGAQCVAIGAYAMKGATGNNYDCVAIGYECMQSITSGTHNVAVGRQAGADITSGTHNVFMGHQAGKDCTTGTGNVSIGAEGFGSHPSGTAVTGSQSVIIGRYAGRNISSGSDNTFIGYSCGIMVSTGTDNVAVGGNCLELNTCTGTVNSLLGRYAGYRISGGHGNVCMGYKSGYNITTGNNSVCVGRHAGYNQAGATGNVFMGYQCGYSNTTGYTNVFIGEHAGYSNTNGQHNTYIGAHAGRDGNNHYNVCMGTYAGRHNTGGSNTFIGVSAGKSGYGNDNVAIGMQARIKGTGSGNIMIGKDTGFGLTSGAGNTYVGTNSGKDCTSGAWNAFLGSASGQFNTTGGYNVCIGNNTNIYNKTGSYNIVIGSNAAHGNSTSVANKNYELYINSHNGYYGEDSFIYGYMKMDDSPFIRFNCGEVGMFDTAPTPSTFGSGNYGKLYVQGGHNGTEPTSSTEVKNGAIVIGCDSTASSWNTNRYGGFLVFTQPYYSGQPNDQIPGGWIACKKSYGNGNFGWGMAFGTTANNGTNYDEKMLLTQSGWLSIDGTYQSSDDRIKHNETTIENPLETLNQLKGKVYFKTHEMYEPNHNFNLDINGEPIDESGNLIDYTMESGFIAQSVLKIDKLKHLVTGGDEYVEETTIKEDLSGNPILDSTGNTIIDEVKTVLHKKRYILNYCGLIPWNTEGIKELYKENQDHNVKILDLYKENQELKARLAKIEAFLGI